MQTPKEKTVVLLLPLAYQDSADVYQGVLAYLTKHPQPWRLRIVREGAALGEILRRTDLDSCDGVICVAQDFPAEQIAARLPKMPLVVLHANNPRAFVRHPRVARVDIDSAGIGRLAARFFAKESAYAAFGFVPSAGFHAWSDERREAFCQALARSRRTAVCFSPPDGAERTDALVRWLQSLPKPAAIFADRDQTAEETLEACVTTGIRVPDEVAVLGVDNELVTCAHTRPTLSSIRPDFAAVGRRAAQVLAGLISGRRMPQATVCHGLSLVERGSTGAPSSAAMLVRQADEIIAAEACQGLQARALARRLKVSRRLLDLRYRQVRGTSVLERIISLRLENLCRMLEDTSLSLAEIVSSSGFNSATNARRIFLARYGQTMADYRRAKRG